MNKRILLTAILAFVVLCSVSAISASDVNVTDSYTTSLVDDTQDVSVPMENTADSSENSVLSVSNVDNDPSKVSLSSEEVLESDDSNILSTNSNGNDEILSSDNGIASLSATNGDVSSNIAKSKTIQSSDVTKYYKGTTKFTAKFLNIKGKVLANTKVKLTVNGVTYTKKTNANGVASLDIDLKPGTYKVVSENPSTGYKATNTFKVLPTISAKDISKVREDARQFTAKFLNTNGKPLANTNVKFKVNGNTYTQKTDSKGVARLTLVSLQPGNYKIVSYNPADGFTKTNTIKVYKKVSSKISSRTYTFYQGETKTIKATLHNAFGYAPGAGKLIKITINGKTYTKQSNAKGDVSLNLPTLKNGVYTVKYSFDGNDYYYPYSASYLVTIISTKNTAFTVKSATSFYKGSHTFKVALTAGGVPLPKKTVTFKVNGKSYTKTTDKNGIASLPIKLAVGKYKISYSVKKDSKTNGKSGSTSLTIKEKKVSKTHNAYWVFGGDMKKVNLNTLSSNGVTDVFLNYYAVQAHGKSAVETWIASANKAGIKVHIWVQAFYSGGWTKPVVNGKDNTAFFNKKIKEIKTYASLKGVAGIHMDYLRFSGSTGSNNAAYQNSGGTQAINSFVKQVVSAVHSINSKLIVSAALMPETTSNVKYYGQDMSVLSKYLDVVVPMIYKGNYNAKSSWITTTTKWFVSNSKGAEVWTGIQTYVADGNEKKLSSADLKTDVLAGFKGGADGIVLFRYGLSNSINFNKISTSSSSSGSTSSSSTTTTGSAKTISVKDVVTGANKIRKYYKEHSKYPSKIKVNGKTYSLEQFLYFMGKAIYQIGNSNKKAITIYTAKAPQSPNGDNIKSEKLAKSKYMVVARNVANYIRINRQAPNYASSAVGNIIYSELIDSFSRILVFYKEHNSLPSYVTINYVSSSSSSSYSATGTGLNEKNTISNLAAYLRSSTNCQVDNSQIKSLVTKLTKGLTSNAQKATAIYNYVRDYISYSFYYDTWHGSVGTLNAGSGNCVDQSHLLIAMFRTADLPARYVHGTCTFSSGSTYGHVWTQVLIGNTWVVADPTSTRNSFGSIVNWNTNSYSVHSISSGISF